MDSLHGAAGVAWEAAQAAAVDQGGVALAVASQKAEDTSTAEGSTETSAKLASAATARERE